MLNFFITHVSVFIDVWRLQAAIFHVRVCEAICNPWELEEFKTVCMLVINCFWKPLVSSLCFLYKPNQTKRYI